MQHIYNFVSEKGNKTLELTVLDRKLGEDEMRLPDNNPYYDGSNHIRMIYSALDTVTVCLAGNACDVDEVFPCE